MLAHGGEVVGTERVLVRNAELAARRHYYDDAAPRVRKQRHRPPGEDRLVIGVGVEEHDGLGPRYRRSPCLHSSFRVRVRNAPAWVNPGATPRPGRSSTI